MGHVGIIAEYNPFHNGHFFQFNTIKKIFPEKEILIVMSGNYVQRGEPAIFNKYIRTKAALSGGASLILELPSLYSCSSAEYFATAALFSLAATNCVDTLCFGAECDDIKLLSDIAKLILEEPANYQKNLQNQLSNGFSFPKARALALCDFFHEKSIATVVSQPNNILAIEYLKTIYKYNLKMEPYIIKRTQNNYHSTDLSNSCCSASAIRKAIYSNNNSLSSYMPEAAWKVITEDTYNKPLFLPDFYPFIQYSLQAQAPLTDFIDVSPELANRIRGLSILPAEIEDIKSQLASKNITNTRISRCLMHILLKNTKSLLDNAVSNNYVPYLRILGFSDGSVLPGALKKNSEVPLLTKVAAYKKIIPENALFLFEQQLYADNLYRQIYYNKYRETIPSEFEHSVIINNRIET